MGTDKYFNWQLTVTFSKIMAFIIIILSFLMDYMNDKGGTVFMYSIPFAVFLITGKQVIDYKKEDIKK